MKKKEIKLYWSKKEKDFVSKYPEWENSNAKILSKNLFFMLDNYQTKLGVKLRDQIILAGFDPDSFTITIKEL